MATMEEVGRLVDNLHEQFGLADSKLTELTNRKMLSPERAEHFRTRLDELRGEMSRGALDDVHLTHIAQQFLNLAFEIWLEPAPSLDPEMLAIHDWLRLETIRLAGEIAAIELELKGLYAECDGFQSDVSKDYVLDEKIRPLEARLKETVSGLEVIHQIRVRLGFVS